jgi:hypothetical protein
MNRRTDNSATRAPAASVPDTRRHNLDGEIGRELGDHRRNSGPGAQRAGCHPLDSWAAPAIAAQHRLQGALAGFARLATQILAVELDQIEGANDRGRAGPVLADEVEHCKHVLVGYVCAA